MTSLGELSQRPNFRLLIQGRWHLTFWRFPSLVKRDSLGEGGRRTRFRSSPCVGTNTVPIRVRRTAVEDPNHRRWCLLPSGGQRPRHGAPSILMNCRRLMRSPRIGVAQDQFYSNTYVH